MFNHPSRNGCIVLDVSIVRAVSSPVAWGKRPPLDSVAVWGLRASVAELTRLGSLRYSSGCGGDLERAKISVTPREKVLTWVLRDPDPIFEFLSGLSFGIGCDDDVNMVDFRKADVWSSGRCLSLLPSLRLRGTGPIGCARFLLLDWDDIAATENIYRLRLEWPNHDWLARLGLAEKPRYVLSRKVGFGPTWATRRKVSWLE